MIRIFRDLENRKPENGCKKSFSYSPVSTFCSVFNFNEIIFNSIVLTQLFDYLQLDHGRIRTKRTEHSHFCRAVYQ